jgi:uncharacterized protein (TIGR02266 family)
MPTRHPEPARSGGIELDLGQPHELLGRVVPNGDLGSLTLEGKAPGPVGTRCQLIVRFAEPMERHFTVEVQIAWVRHLDGARLKRGFGVAFVPEDQAGRDRVLAYARDELSPRASRYDERIATELPVSIRHEGRVRKEKLIDLSHGGAFIRTVMFLPVGSRLEFRVRPPRSLTRVRLMGKVAWVRKTGTARGMGIEFEYESARQAVRVAEMLRKLAPRRAS